MISAEISDQRVVRDFCLRTVRPLIPLASAPRRRSRPFQRGAAQRYSCNQRNGYASSVWLRLRRAEDQTSLLK